jgi:hypothetical protein
MQMVSECFAKKRGGAWVAAKRPPRQESQAGVKAGAGQEKRVTYSFLRLLDTSFDDGARCIVV